TECASRATRKSMGALGEVGTTARPRLTPHDREAAYGALRVVWGANPRPLPGRPEDVLRPMPWRQAPRRKPSPTPSVALRDIRIRPGKDAGRSKREMCDMRSPGD